MPLFEKFFRGHVRTVPGNMLVKFEVRSFMELLLTGLLRTVTHRMKNSISAIHSIQLAEIIEIAVESLMWMLGWLFAASFVRVTSLQVQSTQEPPRSHCMLQVLHVCECIAITTVLLCLRHH